MDKRFLPLVRTKSSTVKSGGISSGNEELHCEQNLWAAISGSNLVRFQRFLCLKRSSRSSLQRWWRSLSLKRTPTMRKMKICKGSVSCSVWLDQKLRAAITWSFLNRFEWFLNLKRRAWSDLQSSWRNLNPKSTLTRRKMEIYGRAESCLENVPEIFTELWMAITHSKLNRFGWFLYRNRSTRRPLQLLFRNLSLKTTLPRRKSAMKMDACYGRELENVVVISLLFFSSSPPFFFFFQNFSISPSCSAENYEGKGVMGLCREMGW